MSPGQRASRWRDDANAAGAWLRCHICPLCADVLAIYGRISAAKERPSRAPSVSEKRRKIAGGGEGVGGDCVVVVAVGDLDEGVEGVGLDFGVEAVEEVAGVLEEGVDGPGIVVDAELDGVLEVFDVGEVLGPKCVDAEHGELREGAVRRGLGPVRGDARQEVVGQEGGGVGGLAEQERTAQGVVVAEDVPEERGQAPVQQGHASVGPRCVACGALPDGVEAVDQPLVQEALEVAVGGREESAASGVDAAALDVEDLVVVVDGLAHVEVACLDLALYVVECVADAPGLDRDVVADAERAHEVAERVAAEEREEAVLDGDEEARGPGVTLAAGAAAELAVDAATLV
eukprot:CAMPEP_0198665332 /NCGR_PEP_ID=MMETSP1467-20131203/59952_1 /TAXON_ID=1462469 /ORGANISM="unid. sp., Strain CCMP2135" /LENGTH=344 /DNA_ID=CAMNT_0044401919 /DNA_START=69 /DNA_END=1100 /DNA_ORIENTATION=-